MYLILYSICQHKKYKKLYIIFIVKILLLYILDSLLINIGKIKYLKVL